MDLGAAIIVGVVLGIVWLLFKAAAKSGQKKIDDQAATQYLTAINDQMSHLVETARSGELVPLDARSLDYRPVGGENLFAVQDGISRLEMRSTGRYASAGPVVSIPIMKGVRYRFSTGSYRSEKQLTPTAHGRLLITDKAIVFESGEKNERITWTQVSDVELMSDGYGISKRNGPRRLYSFSVPDPRTAALIELILQQQDA